MGKALTKIKWIHPLTLFASRARTGLSAHSRI